MLEKLAIVEAPALTGDPHVPQNPLDNFYVKRHGVRFLLKYQETVYALNARFLDPLLLLSGTIVGVFLSNNGLLRS